MSGLNLIRAILIVLIFCCPLQGADLSFETVLQDGWRHAYDLKITAAATRAATAAVGEASAAYYPQLSLGYGQEYVHVFDKYNATVSVGDRVYSDSTSRYKNSLAISFQYNLYDFGRRGLRLEYAHRQVAVAKEEERQASLQLSLRLLELYAQIFKLQKQSSIQEQVCTCQERIYRLMKRLHLAGCSGRQQIGEAALQLAEAATKQEDLLTQRQMALASLSQSTGVTYPPETTMLIDLEGAVPSANNPAVELFPQVRLLAEQVRAKATELKLVRCDYLPRVILRGSYGMYGSHENSYRTALAELSRRDASVGISFQVPLFDGYATHYKIKRLEHELTRLKLEKDKAENEMTADLVQARLRYVSLKHLSAQRAKVRRTVMQQHADLERLNNEQLKDQISMERSQVALLVRQQQLEVEQIDWAASAMRLTLMTEVSR